MTIFHFKEAPPPQPSGRMPETHCPCCEEMLDAVTSLDADGAPEPGDVSLCAYCGEILQFDEDMQLTKVTEEVWNSLPLFSRSELIKVQGLVRSKRSPFK